MKPFSKSKILCIGDIILDSYIQGNIERISPEAPIPIFKLGTESYVLGGAGNVARNVTAGGGECHLISVVGNDSDNKILGKLIKNEKDLSSDLISVIKRKTTKKQRYISGQHQVLRVDEENDEPINSIVEKKVFQTIEKMIKNFNVVIISDYNKGMLTASLVQKIIILSRKYNKPIIVDPKRDSFEIYKGATILTPNLNELYNATKREFKNKIETSEINNIDFLSRKLINKFNFNSIITTRSVNGMSVIIKNKKQKNLSSEALEVFDVSGAGDTVVAYLSLGISVGNDIESSARMANQAAGIAVGKFGTASVNFNELLKLNSKVNKVMSLSKIKRKIKSLKNKKIGFTNGCFDLIHSGHVNYLSAAKESCDILILGVNSDSSVKKIKGVKRPIISQDDRLAILSAFFFIDFLIIFDELTPLKLIKSLRPDIIFKGADYKSEEVVGNKEVSSWGGEVKLLNYVNGKSTTNLIERIKNEA